MCSGLPTRVSICHCLSCKRRTGSAFAWNASFPEDMVQIAGAYHSFSRKTDSGRTNVYHFCPSCGSTLFYHVEMRPGTISIPVGAFADPDFSPPTVELFDDRRPGWCEIDLS
ncbi:GFA family protein [Sphingobium herbicidovorans]|nr:GFA family protein [Sphingobium herbicidovorans]